MPDGYIGEYRPATPTGHLLVAELAQAHWCLRRADAVEAELFSPGGNTTYAATAAAFRENDPRMDASQMSKATQRHRELRFEAIFQREKKKARTSPGQELSRREERRKSNNRQRT
jgi:hypothetical protein